jgi:hypothetical protein
LFNVAASPQHQTKKTDISVLRQKRFISVVLAAKPPEQPKKIVISMLPQAENAHCGASNHADCDSQNGGELWPVLPLRAQARRLWRAPGGSFHHW